MKNKNLLIIAFSLGFCVTCFIWGLIWMTMCLDYKQQLIELKKENYILNQNVNTCELFDENS